MTSSDDVWIPLVDEPIGSIVRELEQADPAILGLVGSPRRLLAFRTFAYIRVGVLLGRLLVEEDLEARPDWVDELMRDPDHREQVEREVRAVAEAIAADPRYEGDDEPLGPDDGARARFREFARRQLDGSS
jgi:hypothetical protein